MGYNAPPTLVPVAFEQLAVCHENGFVSHVLSATDAEGSLALQDLSALWQPLAAPDPGRELPAEALLVTVGASMPANFRPDIHFYSPAWGRDIIDGHALSRVSVHDKDDLPTALDDFLALTDRGMVGLDIGDVRALLEATHRRVGRYFGLQVEPPWQLGTALNGFQGARAALVSVRLPKLAIGDPRGFELLSAAHMALGSTPSYLDNVSPARGEAARLGVFIWNGTAGAS
ncbi:hypothetical protein H0Z60_19735 [Ectothiorhodospiraceae bacterium WFHF3C12]|nr:hypothetical protein [Ectothiorhodospiraceae bacterium WFHF3C12]